MNFLTKTPSLFPRRSWGYRRNMVESDVLSLEEILDNLVTTVSCGGNMLLNVGPDSDGVIPPIFQQRLAQLGQWLDINGQAIYSSRPWRCQNDTLSPDVWYTSKAGLSSIYHKSMSWVMSMLCHGSCQCFDVVRIISLFQCKQSSV